METGRDLRDREQAELRELAERCRLLILPTGNPDGLARFEAGALQGMEPDDIRFWGQGTWSDDWLCGWPQVKRRHPVTSDDVNFLGCYFDDAGVNAMHDDFTRPLSVTAPAILDIARAEGPDLVVALHSSTPPPWLIRGAYTPLESQQVIHDLAVLFNELLEEIPLPHGVPPTPGPEKGEIPRPYNLVSAIYHVSGAAAAALECPHGIQPPAPFPEFSLEDILEIQLALYRAMLRSALDMKA
jgi:hypothetical protein